MLGAVMLGVLEERDLRLLWLGQATSAFGSGLVPVALAFAVIDLTASTATLGLVLSVALASGVGVLLFGGVVADRVPRGRQRSAQSCSRVNRHGSAARTPPGRRGD
jgi:MFS family permease